MTVFYTGVDLHGSYIHGRHGGEKVNVSDWSIVVKVTVFLGNYLDIRYNDRMIVNGNVMKYESI